jgi:hypothetical protein
MGLSRTFSRRCGQGLDKVSGHEQHRNPVDRQRSLAGTAAGTSTPQTAQTNSKTKHRQGIRFMTVSGEQSCSRRCAPRTLEHTRWNVIFRRGPAKNKLCLHPSADQGYLEEFDLRNRAEILLAAKEPKSVHIRDIRRFL